MEQKTSEKVRRSTNRIGGVSIAWITLYGALCGVTGLIPIFPYVGGGGYVPLTTPLSAIAPLLLGPVGGVVAALVGGVIGMFIAPALYAKEKKVILRLVVPAVLLFAGGVAIAFLVVLPFTFTFLYSVAASLGAQRLFLPLDEFLDFTLIFTLGFGLAFEMPIVMYALTASGMIRAVTWRKYWRLAIIGIFFFGAFITPDGSGVTMLLVALPMTGLYVAGYVAAALSERRREQH